MKSVFYALLLVFISLSSSCMPAPVESSPTTSTPSPTLPTATQTVVWFPSTATSTPFPTILVTPTAEMRTGIGDLLVADQFDNPDQWSLITTDGGSVAFGKNEITIAISKERLYLFSVRKELNFDNFYVEITANPNLCRDGDEYGMLIRVTPSQDYYRFSLSCDGQVRLDRIYQNQASSPQPWISSGSVPPGAPSISRLGVWAHGEEMRFFVNDEFQFTARDPLIVSGSFGVFARSSTDFAVTVNFSDLVVRDINLP